MTLLIGIAVALTYTEPPAEEGKFEPSLLLRAIGGWDDIELVKDAHLAPVAHNPREAERALAEFRKIDSEFLTGENEAQLERMRTLTRDREPWDEEFAEQILKQYEPFFRRVLRLTKGPRLTLPPPSLGRTEGVEAFAVLKWARVYNFRTRACVEGRAWEDALDALREWNNLATYLAEGSGVLVDYLVNIAIENSFLDSAHELLENPSLPASSVSALRELLQAEPAHRRILVETWKHEYRYQKRACNSLADGLTIEPLDFGRLLIGGEPTVWDQLEAVAFRCAQQVALAVAYQPNRTIQRQVEITEHLIELTQLNAAARKKALDPELISRPPLQELLHSNGVGEGMVGAASTQLLHAIKRTDVIVAYRRLLVGLCGVLHHRRIHGALPNSLEAIAPEHLPRIPTDPYDGKSVRYSKERARLWVTGEDLEDDGGTDRENQRRFGRPSLPLDREQEGDDPTLYVGPAKPAANR